MTTITITHSSFWGALKFAFLVLLSSEIEGSVKMDVLEQVGRPKTVVELQGDDKVLRSLVANEEWKN